MPNNFSSLKRNIIQIRILNSAVPTRLPGIREFHVSRKARDKYQFDLSMFSITGNVIFANFGAARLFAQKMNEPGKLTNAPEEFVRASDINAVGLIDEIFHNMISQYRQQSNPKIFKSALAWLEDKFDKTVVDKILKTFVDNFPPLPVYLKKQTINEYLKGKTGGEPNRQIALEEMLLLWLTNFNPACQKFSELFDDSELRDNSPYLKAMEELKVFFKTQKPVQWSDENLSLMEVLQSPVSANPNSLTAQLRFMKDKWGIFFNADLNVKWESILDPSFVDKWGVPPSHYQLRLLRGMDFLSEEHKMRFDPGLGQPPAQVPEYSWADAEPEQFSIDLHWMPKLVLIAKSALVWLGQLSKTYERAITKLSDIPDQELDKLAGWGFTGLWLIGIWERSGASKKIKQDCGNPDAEASAYALFDYQIAWELGGDEAYQNLRERCWQRGIRLASDMVPNHTGIVSKWVNEHPDWFIQLPFPPYPSYQFDTQDLSNNPDVGIYLEKRYYDKSDASVVFKRLDKRTGIARYIYHGNDGTNMPWNDTAQLNYLKKEVREAVIEKILDVARKFPIIRFDAAMTLAKKHYQRLWYPEPGSGGDIPSRAEYGLTKSQFEKIFPVEFWREVVDRVAREAPDTLLLAEAFWMMEGYFVRSLGMHRVYNSAFMNMLKNEENKKYRYTIKNTIEFEPEVLKRYVNFMNNPDEETAIQQFGDGDKYFGICILMSTMPGLPMFGHGQIEGLREKYGMEFRRAHWDETPNQYLISRHEREISPLLKKRYLFAEVENFLFYDLYGNDGAVNENVFAYSNRYNNEKALVIFNNAGHRAGGWIRTSVGFSEKDGRTQEKRITQKTLGEGLSISTGHNSYLIFRDHISGLEFIHRCNALWEKGLYIELEAYQYRVFLDFREVKDNVSQEYARLCKSLGGQGIANIEEARKEIYLQPILQAFRNFVNGETFKPLLDQSRSEKTLTLQPGLGDKIAKDYTKFLKQVQLFGEFKAFESIGELSRQVRQELETVLEFSGTSLKERFAIRGSRKFIKALKCLDTNLSNPGFTRGLLLSWVFVHRLGMLSGEKNWTDLSRRLIDEWLLHKTIHKNLRDCGWDDQTAVHAVTLMKLLTTHQDWYKETTPKKNRSYHLFNKLINEREFRHFLKVNRFDETIWFNKEAFETITGWLFLIAVLQEVVSGAPSTASSLTAARPPLKSPEKIASGAKQISKKPLKDRQGTGEKIVEIFGIWEKWQKAKDHSEYKVVNLLEGLKATKKPTTKKPAL